MIDHSHKAVNWLLCLTFGALTAVLADLQTVRNKNWGHVLQQREAFTLLHWQSMSGGGLFEQCQIICTETILHEHQAS